MTKKRFVNKGKDILQYGEWYCSAGGEHCADVIATAMNELIEENGQLKQRNNRQVKQLDRLYNLIEEKDWRTLTDILDDFKRCEEQLQKEWGTYGDFE
jgi:hypothetical protein